MILRVVEKVLRWMAVADKMPPQERLPAEEVNTTLVRFREMTKGLRREGPFSVRMSKLLRRRKKR